MRAIWRWLTESNPDQYLSSEWLSDTARMREYEAFTVRQTHSMVVTGALDMWRRELWVKATARHEADVRQFPRRFSAKG